MDTDEVRPDDVPVHVLEREAEIDQRDQAVLQDADQLLALLAIEAGREKRDLVGLSTIAARRHLTALSDSGGCSSGTRTRGEANQTV